MVFPITLVLLVGTGCASGGSDAGLEAAVVPEPYLLVGSSGGGGVVVQYAVEHRTGVAGLALFDVGVPKPDLDKEFPGEEIPEDVAQQTLSTLS